MSILAIPECDDCKWIDDGLFVFTSSHDTPEKAIEMVLRRMGDAGWTRKGIKDYCPKCSDEKASLTS